MWDSIPGLPRSHLEPPRHLKRHISKEPQIKQQLTYYRQMVSTQDLHIKILKCQDLLILSNLLLLSFLRYLFPFLFSNR